MFFYQTIIMVAVAVLIYLLTYFLMKRHRKVLLLSILAIIAAAGVGLYAIQFYFGNHYYTQNINTDDLENITISGKQARDINKVFSDYKPVNDGAKKANSFKKIYKIDKNGVNSVIEAHIYVFSQAGDADKYFEANQKFYENKNYIPLDMSKSKRKGSGERYLVSLVKSRYRNYSDLIYLPSKIRYSSDVTIVYNNVILTLNENADKPSSNKALVIGDIKKKLSQKT